MVQVWFASVFAPSSAASGFPLSFYLLSQFEFLNVAILKPPKKIFDNFFFTIVTTFTTITTVTSITTAFLKKTFATI